jgi:Abnormal spindle-like microcephaly-assoc'd, ASPM-SPD-2-Hydin
MSPVQVAGKAERGTAVRSGVVGAALLFSILFVSGCGAGGSMAGGPSAVPSLVVSPSQLSFANVSVGSDSTQTITLSNLGGVTLVVSSATVTGTGFSLSGLAVPLNLGAGQSARATVAFAPSGAGTTQGTIAIASNAANSPADITLSGTGVTYWLTLRPGGLSFDNVSPGQNAVLPLLLQSTGTGAITISRVMVSGAGFTVANPSLPLTLTPGGDSNLSVTFAPAAAAKYSGSLTVVSNASDSPTVAALTGSGSAGVAYSVSLSWKASTSADVVGYKVYRSVNADSNYQVITQSPVKETNYVDTTVLGGTYYYYATAVNSKNQESRQSNTVSVVVP